MKHTNTIMLLLYLWFLNGCCSYISINNLRGTWSYKSNVSDHGFNLRGFWNNDNKFVFKYVKQFYEAEPVFDEYSISNKGIKITFNLLSYDQSSSKGKVKLLLHQVDKNTLQGKLCVAGRLPETITLKRYSPYMDTKPFIGTWTHAPIVAGKKRQHTLRCSKDNTGRLTFEFLKQYYSYEPVFTECSVKGNEIEIKFKLTSYGKGKDSKYTVKYVLKFEDGSLVGKLYESWKEPVDVILTPAL